MSKATPDFETMKSLGTKLVLNRPSPCLWIVLVALILQCPLAQAGDPTVEIVDLPPLRIQGQSARAHTQGLEVIDGQYYVTARRDDVRPKRALLLRTAPGTSSWDVWDITPPRGKNTDAILDHPGGFQSDGKRLWIPLAESRRDGSSLIRVFALTNIVADQVLRSEFEFPVDDHIGALAVNTDGAIVCGASWDTETVYVWNFDGKHQRTLTGTELEIRDLGVSKRDPAYAALAVQDWKFIRHRLIASGLFRGSTSGSSTSKSRLIVYEHILESRFQKRIITLPSPEGVKLANEGMVVADGMVHFLPEDLKANNRLFRIPVSDLFPE